MISRRMFAIIKREIKAQIFTKKFIFMTLSFPLIMAVLIGVQVLIQTYQSEDKSYFTLITESNGFQTQLQNQFAESELNDASLYAFTYLTLSRPEVETYIEDNRQDLLSNKITGVLFIPDSTKDDKKFTYYSTNPGNQNLLSKFRTEINRSIVAEYFEERNIERSAVEYARQNMEVDGIRVTKEGTSNESPASFILAAVLTFLLYMSLLIAGPTVMGVVNEEKTNRVVEVLLSSVSSNELMAGKVLGTAIAFLAQMFIWLLPFILLSLGALPMFTAIGGIDIDINIITLVYYLFNYFLGLLIYLSIFSVFGAIFDNPQEAQSSMMPVIMLILIPFFVATTLARNPANFMAEVCSILPFFSIIIMPARMTLIDVPIWQIALAIVVNIGTFFLVIKMAGKLYRVTILVTGKRPGWKEMIKWIRYS